jgi:Zn-dependent alcohol dehydrogenase
VAAGICHTDISMRDHIIYPVPHPVVLGQKARASSSVSARA